MAEITDAKAISAPETATVKEVKPLEELLLGIVPGDEGGLEIITESKIVDKQLVETLLKVIPPEDLEGLRRIVVKDREEACPNREETSYYDPEWKEVFIHIQRLRASLEDIARVLYHEIAHHAQHNDPEWVKKVYGVLDEIKEDTTGETTYKHELFESYIAHAQAFANSYADKKLEELNEYYSKPEITIESKLVDIDKSTVKRILRVIPDEDINGLKKIIITDRWIGGDAFYDPNMKMVGIHVPWALGQSEETEEFARKHHLHDGQKSPEGQRRNVMEEIAFDIFHEIAHHVQDGDRRWNDFTKSDSLGKITHRIDRTELYLAYEQFANSYADEKLEKLRQMDPEVLSPYARTRSLVQTRMERLRGGG